MWSICTACPEPAAAEHARRRPAASEPKDARPLSRTRSFMTNQALPILPESAPFPPDHIQALNGVMAAANLEQRHWLSGFLAGYQAAAGSVAAPAPSPAKKDPADHRLCDRQRQFRGGRGKRQKTRGQAGIRRKARRFRRRHARRPRQVEKPPDRRQHLGRGGPAGARRRGLSGPDG